MTKVLEIEDYLHLQKSKASKERVAKLAMATTAHLRAIDQHEERQIDFSAYQRQLLVEMESVFRRLREVSQSWTEVELFASEKLASLKNQQIHNLCRND